MNVLASIVMSFLSVSALVVMTYFILVTILDVEVISNIALVMRERRFESWSELRCWLEKCNVASKCREQRCSRFCNSYYFEPACFCCGLSFHPVFLSFSGQALPQYTISCCFVVYEHVFPTNHTALLIMLCKLGFAYSTLFNCCETQ